MELTQQINWYLIWRKKRDSYFLTMIRPDGSPYWRKAMRRYHFADRRCDLAWHRQMAQREVAKEWN